MFTIINNTDIYGLKPVNRGVLYTFDLVDPINPNRPLIMEISRPEQLNPDYYIATYYFWDVYTESKIAITLYHSTIKSDYGAVIYHFKNKDSLQHYRSSNYAGFNKLPKKYKNIVNYIKKAFIDVYGQEIG